MKKMKKKRPSVIDGSTTIVVDHNGDVFSVSSKPDDHDRCYQNRGNHHRHRSRRRRRRSRRKTPDQTLPHDYYESSAHVPTTTTSALHHYKPISTRGCGGSGDWPITTILCTSLIFTIIINIIATIQGTSAATVSLPVSEPYHTTANLGENVVLRCVFDFPEGYRVPYVIQWEKKGIKIPIYIWYDGYHPHIGEGYEDRVSLSGRASLNLTNVRESDQGWYECKVFFLNRPPEPIKNGTWIHLDVLAPPRFRVKPPDVIYVKVGESVTLPCEAYGTPTPQITWYKDNKPLKANSNVQIYNHELQIDNLQLSDIGEYRCTSRNREGAINAITKIIIAGPAVITIPPKNLTKLQGDRVEFLCEARALPSNVTYRWYHDGQEIGHLPWQESRFMIKSGMLIINPSVAEDSGRYVCEVSNGIGSPDTAEAYLNIEFPARVYYSPTIQYLPLGLSGIVRCFIQASPPFQFVTWTKDRRPFDPNSAPDVTTMQNGSLYMKKVSLEHQGIYRCTPYNIHGTAESSQPMEVLVRDPPMFTSKPKDKYIKAVNDEVSISCDGSGQPKPNIFWRKSDGSKLPRERTTTRAGNLTIKLLKKEDHGQYECVAENEIATISVPTMIIINNTTPHTPTNISVNTSYFAATVQWQPNYNGGYEQTFHLSYRLSDQGDVEWKTVRVPPPETTNAFTLYNLQSDNEYEFQVYASNRLGAGAPSPVVKAKTKPWSFGEKIYPTDASGATYIPTVQKPSGPKPDAPRNLTLQRMAQGWVLSWLAPVNNSVAVAYYRVEYRRDDDQWLYTDPIPYDTAFLFEKLEPNSRYIFRVWAYSILGVGEVSPMIEVNIDDYNDTSQSHFRAMVASIIGGFIFFSMSIMLALCIVKVCNKKKRRKIEKSYVMVTCPVNGNSCYSSDNSVPSKQQLEMFDPNSQATSEFMINLPIGVGSLDISNVMATTAPSLDNSTTTTNTTGTTGSDQQPLVGETPTLMSNMLMMQQSSSMMMAGGQWPTAAANILVHNKACYQSGATPTTMAIRHQQQQQGSSMLMASNSPSPASSQHQHPPHFLVDHQPSPTYTMMMSNIGVSEMQTIQPYPSGPVVNRLMMTTNNTHNHTHNSNLDSNNPSIISSSQSSQSSSNNTNSHTHHNHHHISNHHLHHNHPPLLQDHYPPPPPPPAPPNDVL